MTDQAVVASTRGIEKALETYDRSLQAKRVDKAEYQRQEILRRFAIDSWPSLPLEHYALGQEGSEDTYCRWLEFRSAELGSMRGGNATKLVIYKHRDKPGWFFYPPATDEQEAWERLRAGFVAMFQMAQSGRWEDIDGIVELSSGPVLRCKTLHVYFPQHILPVYSVAHLQHFLRLLDRPEADDRSYAVVHLNRALLEALRRVPALADWTTVEIGLFLYHWSDPREAARVIKVSPGHDAKFWQECLAGGYICVGWKEIGDLRQYESEQDFRTDFDAKLLERYKGNTGALRTKGRELWTFGTLEPGDLVVANRGISRVLGLGTVEEPGYVYDQSRTEYRHTVRVKWDLAHAKDIPSQKRWALQTVAEIPPALQRLILTRDGTGAGPVVAPTPSPPLFLEIADALARKAQVILYGPPGTGKTYIARQFATWWLLRESGHSDPAEVLSSAQGLKQAEQKLGSNLTLLTFHPSYSYEDFVEGFRPVETSGGGLQLRLEDGILKRVCREAANRPAERFLILIDEINRANIAKVFGELITLLEVDKRGLQVTLPQSKDKFTVPPNVLLLGTMNTADRSIKLFDAALRRRFAFIEMMPDPELLSGTTVNGLPLDDFLERLNQRIREKEGREKQIGHAFLLQNGEPVADTVEFARRFRQEILPLLQEYCYEDYHALAALLGPKLVDAEAQTINATVLMDSDSLVQALLETFGTSALVE